MNSDWTDEVPTDQLLDALGKDGKRTTRAVTETLQDLARDGVQDADRGFQIHRLEDLLDEPEPERQWLCDRLLPADGLSLVVAPPKAGKSTLVRSLAATVANGGGKWLNRAVTTGTVLHLALEERKSTVVRHYRRLGARNGVTIILDASRVAPDQRTHRLTESIMDERPALAIIDTLGRWAPVEDGNSYAQVTAITDPLIRIARKYRVHICLVHHARKSGGQHGEEALGSQAFMASVDTLVSIKRASGNRRTIESTGRDGQDIETAEISLGETGHVVLGPSLAAQQLDTDKTAILTALEGGPLTRAALVEKSGVPGKRLPAAAQSLEYSGLVEKTGRGRRGDPYSYSLRVP